jgi:amidase
MNIETKNLWKKSASEIISLLDKKEITIEEVLDSSLGRIKKINPDINAIVTLIEEEEKKKLINNFNNTNSTLKGMPVLIKDMNDVQNMRTTYGSKLYSDYIPKNSDIIVKTIEKNGGLIIGKTNIPEFAAGSHTYNSVFGLTKNPWNTSLSAGGSSGGAAAALATGMCWFASGSDLGGSLRNPASWCGVVGLRPTSGLIPHGPSNFPFFNLSVDGPMARNVEDLSIFLDAMVDHNRNDPLSFKSTKNSYYNNLLKREESKYLIGFTDDFGVFPCDKEVRGMMHNTLKLVQSLGHDISNTFPDMSKSEYCFQTLRAYIFYCTYKSLLKKDKSLIKEEIIWNINKAKTITIDELLEAEKVRADIYKNTMQFFDKFDFLIAPSSIVPPFNSEEKWVKKVEDTTFDNYVSWLMIAASISLTNCPSIAIATSFSKDNAPFGIQIVAPPYEEQKLINFAKSLEENINISDIVPINVNNENI